MKVKNIYKLLLLLPAMTACQSEEAVIADNTETPRHKLTVRATLPGEVESRTHITYGNQDTTCEFFRWHPYTEDYDANDYITVFNVSKSSYGVELNLVDVDDKTNSAVFESMDTVDSSFKIEKGDVFFVSYWKVNKEDGGNEVYKIEMENKPQPILVDPFADDYMTYMQGSLKMYDIVKVEEDNKIPDIHFKHLCGIMRVTLRNETGENLWPKLLQFESPGNTPFLKSPLYCKVDATAGSLSVYEDTKYSDVTEFPTNNYTAANTETGTALQPGESYDLYVPFIPREDNEADVLIIRLEGRDSSSKSTSYEIAIDPFGVSLEAGLRYWFNLTAVNDGGERRLMFTNQWLYEHPEEIPGEGEDISPEE